MTLRDWLLAGDVADHEIEGAEALDWFHEQMVAKGDTGGFSCRTGAGRSRPRRKRRWSRARVVKAIQRWLALLGPFAALVAALLGLFRRD